MNSTDSLPPGPATILVVDDHPIVRTAIAQLVGAQPDLELCGEADNAETALQAVATLKPDIAIVDVSLRNSGGFELLGAIRQIDPHLPVLMLSMHDESIYAERALRAGANGYLMKQEGTDCLLRAVRQILRGESYFSPNMAKKMLTQFLNRSGAAKRHSLQDLTHREREVFRLIGHGLGTRQIADELQLSARTVESHYAHIKKKLSLSNVRELMQHAVQWNRFESGRSDTGPEAGR